ARPCAIMAESKSYFLAAASRPTARITCISAPASGCDRLLLPLSPKVPSDEETPTAAPILCRSKRFSPSLSYLRPDFRFCQASCRQAGFPSQFRKEKSVSLVLRDIQGVTEWRAIVPYSGRSADLTSPISGVCVASGRASDSVGDSQAGPENSRISAFLPYQSKLFLPKVQIRRKSETEENLRPINTGIPCIRTKTSPGCRHNP